MIITASQSGLWTRIVRNDGLRTWEEAIPNQEAHDLYLALRALFQISPPLEPPEDGE